MNLAEVEQVIKDGGGEIVVDVTTDEKATIQSAANAAGLTIEAWIIDKLERHIRQVKKQRAVSGNQAPTIDKPTLLQEIGEEFDKLPATQLKDKLLAAMETLTIEQPKSVIPKGPNIFGEGNKAPVISV